MGTRIHRFWWLAHRAATITEWWAIAVLWHVSTGLLRTMSPLIPYLHSRADDLESFYYTAQWVVVFDDSANGGKYDGEWIEIFFERRYLARGKTSVPLRRRLEEYGPFFAHSGVLLRV